VGRLDIVVCREQVNGSYHRLKYVKGVVNPKPKPRRPDSGGGPLMRWSRLIACGTIALARLGRLATLNEARSIDRVIDGAIDEAWRGRLVTMVRLTKPRIGRSLGH